MTAPPREAQSAITAIRRDLSRTEGRFPTVLASRRQWEALLRWIAKQEQT